MLTGPILANPQGASRASLGLGEYRLDPSNLTSLGIARATAHSLDFLVAPGAASALRQSLERLSFLKRPELLRIPTIVS